MGRARRWLPNGKVCRDEDLRIHGGVCDMYLLSYCSSDSGQWKMWTKSKEYEVLRVDLIMIAHTVMLFMQEQNQITIGLYKANLGPLEFCVLPARGTLLLPARADVRAISKGRANGDAGQSQRSNHSRSCTASASAPGGARVVAKGQV